MFGFILLTDGANVSGDIHYFLTHSIMVMIKLKHGFLFDEMIDEILWGWSYIWIDTLDFPDTEIVVFPDAVATWLGYKVRCVTVDLGMGDYDAKVFVEIPKPPTNEYNMWIPVEDWVPTDAEMVEYLEYLFWAYPERFTEAHTG